MARGTVAQAPNGDRWVVRRRWLDRPLPDLRRRFRAGRNEELEDDVLGGLPGADWADGWPAIALTVAIILIVFVLLPVLGVALEVIALIFVLFSGVVGRLLLGRPWTVEARPDGGDGKKVEIPVKGWRRAGRVIAELTDEIRAGGDPQRFEVREQQL
jgi:hypothetical protein